MRRHHMSHRPFLLAALCCLAAVSTAFAQSTRTSASPFGMWGDDLPALTKVKPPAGWTAAHAGDQNTAFQPSATQQAQGLAIFSRPFETDITPAARPHPDEQASELRLFAARNTYEPATFSITPLRDWPNVRVTLSELRDSNGHVFPQEHLDLRREAMLYRIPADGWDKRIYEPYGGVLLKQEGHPLIAGRTQRFWINIFVSEKAQPGIYTGDITIRSDDTSIARLTLKLRVLDFTLPRAKGAFGYWYGPRWPASADQARRQIEDMRATGMNTVIMSHLFPQPRETSDGVSLDFSRIDAFVSEMRSEGMDGPVVFDGRTLNGAASVYGMRAAGKAPPSHLDLYEAPVEKSPAAEKIFSNMMAQIHQHAKATGWGPTYVYTQEEASNKAVRMAALQYFSPIVKRVLGRGILFSNATWAGIDEARMLPDTFDVRTYNFVDDNVLRSIQKTGNTLWLYNMPKSRAMMGWYVDRVGAQGLSQWAYQWYGGKNAVDPFAAKGSTLGWFYTYPTSAGPVPTQQSMVLRAAMDDLRYIQQFRQCVTQARASGDARKAALANSAWQWFTQWRDSIPVKTTDAADMLDKQAPSYFHTLRWQLAYFILQLQK